MEQLYNLMDESINKLNKVKEKLNSNIPDLLKNIRDTRKEKKISQMAMAGILGIDYSTYGKIERGEISLTVDRMERIAELLNVPVSEIYPRANTSNIELLEALQESLNILKKRVWGNQEVPIEEVYDMFPNQANAIKKATP